MKSTYIAIAVLGIAGIAYSQTIDSVARGRGTARNADGLPVAFNFQAQKSNASGRVAIKGSMSAIFGSPRVPERQTKLDMPSLNRLGFDRRVAHFVGPASFSRLVRGTWATMRGKAEVRVADNRAAGATTRDPDTISIVWTSLDGSQRQAFKGRVISGDIVVRHAAP